MRFRFATIFYDEDIMKKYLALLFVFSAVASASVFATQAEYDKCMKKCAKLMDTPDDKEKCFKFCEYFLQDE